jgi:superfamily II DNA or RNA helicase
MVRAILDHKIRVRLKDLPDGTLGLLMEALSIPNLAKYEAQKQHVWGWQAMPDTIDLWDMDGDFLVMPRGFAKEFGVGMRMLDQEVEWIDNRTWNELFRIGEIPDLRPWQEPAAAEIVRQHQGIYKAPAGSGKTVTILATIRQLGCKSLVIVNTKDIVWQWQERAAQFLGEDYPVGQIGDGIFDVSPYLTIATAQTLHSRFDELEEDGFFDEFSFVCLDECHHATAETYNRILDRFSARYRVGVSATPDKTGNFALSTLVLGPVIHETKPAAVTTLMRPEVIRIPTKFGFGFRPTKSQWQRSNYPQMIQALVTNPERNALIARIIKEEESHHGLAISKRLEHLDILEALLYDMNFDGHILKLTGKENREDRLHVVQIASVEPCIILSTLADEALDIPRLDRGFLCFPQKNPGLVTQQVGRFERVHPDKKDARIYDFADMNVGPLEKQWRTRRFEVYEPRGYTITTRKVEAHA